MTEPAAPHLKLGLIPSATAPDQGLNFEFSPGVFAVDGNFLSRDAGFKAVPALVDVFFDDGTSSVQYVSNENGFSGFISSLAITQLIVEAYPPARTTNYRPDPTGIVSTGAFPTSFFTCKSYMSRVIAKMQRDVASFSSIQYH